MSALPINQELPIVAASDEEAIAVAAHVKNRDDAELAWNFSKTLSHAFALPSFLEPLECFKLHVAWGEVKVTADALVLAISFHSEVTRRP